MSIVVMGAVFVDIKGYPLSSYIPGGRNAGRVVQVHGGVSRNIVEDIANGRAAADIRQPCRRHERRRGRCQKAPEPQGRHALHPHNARRHGNLACDL